MRVLCACLPGYGHFNPLVPLARALVRAGHEVAFATAEDFCPRVAQAGFAAFPAGMGLRQQIEEAARKYPESKLPPGVERWQRFVPRMLAGVAAPARAADLVPLVRQWGPDVVLHDETDFAAPLAAAVAGIPWASHGMAVPRPLALARLAGEVIAPLCRDWGVDLGPLAGLYRYLHFDTCPPSLRPAEFRPPPELGCGAAPQGAAPGARTGQFDDDIPATHAINNTEDLDTAADDVLPPWIDDLAPVPTVYVTLGTVHNASPTLYTTILEGMADLDLNVIVTLGHGADPDALGAQPDNVHVERYIPLSMLLPHLDVVVTQGGTSILPALGGGLPLLVVPQSADQFYNAGACLSAGVGRRLLPPELVPAAVHREVRTLLEEPSFGERARAVQAEITRMPAPDDCVEVLERLAREPLALTGRGAAP